MANRKYLKFGLRADKNLSDLTSKTEGLGNLLNNLDKDIRDVHGDRLGFRVSDVIAMQQLSQTDIELTAESATAIPEAWGWLRNNISFQSVDGRNVDIQPLVTIQDEINNGKIVLGDPPFTSGGTGPLTTFIPSNRFANYQPNAGKENEKVSLDQIAQGRNVMRRGNRYRIESMGSSVVSDTLWNNISTVTSSGYQVGSIFTASTDGVHKFSHNDMTDTSDGAITLSDNHGLRNGMEVKYKSSIPFGDTTNLTNNDTYFVANVGTAGPNTIKLVENIGDAPIDFTKPQITDVNDPSGAIRSGKTYSLELVGYSDAEIRNVTLPTGQYASETDNLEIGDLNSTLLYTKQISPGLNDLVINDNFYTSTGFNLTEKFDNTFPNDFGGVQFEGFQSRGFNPVIRTNGFFVAEQDLSEDENDPNGNWELIKGINSDRIRPTYSTTWGTVSTGSGDRTRIQLNSNGEDIKRVALGMTVSLNHDAKRAAEDARDAFMLANGITDITDSRLEPYDDAILDARGTTGTSIQSIDTTNNTITLNEKYRTTDSNDVTQDQTSSGTFDIEFSWSHGSSTNTLLIPVNVSRPVGSQRRKVRYTVWWPDRGLIGRDLVPGSFKRWEDDSSNRSNFASNDFYKEQNNKDYSNEKYSFPFYRDSRASALQQESKNQLKVEYTVRNNYEPVKYAELTTPYYDKLTYGDEGRMGAITVRLGPNGTLTWKDSEIQEAIDDGNSSAGMNSTNKDAFAPHNVINSKRRFLGEVGDLVVCLGLNSGLYHAFKIEEVDAGNQSTTDNLGQQSILVDPSYATVTGIPEGTAHKILVIKNKGLHGIYRYSNSTNKVHQLPTSSEEYSYHVNEISKEDFIYKVDFVSNASGVATQNQTNNVAPTASLLGQYNGNTPNSFTYANVNEVAFKLETVDHNDSLLSSIDEASITVSTHPQAQGSIFPSSQSMSTQNGIVLAYSSKGLSDKSSSTECTGVFGHEVASTATGGSSSTLTLKSVEGISVGDIVHLDGTVPQDVSNPTTVATVNGATKTIALGNDNGAVVISKDAPPGTTVVFVPATAGPNSDGWGKQNKEYCVTPLNTAPPWAGTDEGLETTDSFSNIIAKELRFAKMTFEGVPTNQITNLPDNVTTATQYFDIDYVD